VTEYQLPQPGDVLAGKYRIERLLGQGGMGAVFAAHHEILSERVALKFLLSDIAANQEAVGRFLNEARAAAKIKSQHVCRIMDAEVTSDGLPFMVLEYLEGQDLAQVLESRGPLPFHEAVDYVLQALEPVHQAHNLGIVHRDLKPANLFLCQQPDGGTLVKVLDFGISKAQNPLGEAANGSLTSTKAMLGSPLYMSPEQLRSSKRVTAVSDVWSLGVILYELLTGAVPYGGDTLGELFANILEEEPVAITLRAPHVPPGLEAVVMHCLKKKDSERMPSVAELASALIPFGTGTYGASLARGGGPRSYATMEAVGTGVHSMGNVRAAMLEMNGPVTVGPITPAPTTLPSDQVAGRPPVAGPPAAAQTLGNWSGTGESATAPKSRAPLFAVAGIALLVIGGGGAAIALRKATPATGGPGTATASATAQETAGTGTTAPATATPPSATQAVTAPTLAPSASAAPTVAATVPTVKSGSSGATKPTSSSGGTTKPTGSSGAAASSGGTTKPTGSSSGYNPFGNR
jgi:tRNA A-37 threonylcarbamoyl transferase component Bud32